MAARARSSGPSKEGAIRKARNFVYSNSYGTLNTINQGDREFSGFPVGQIEYYSDTGDDDASLLMIRVDMSSAFGNINKGSTASFAIRTGDSPNGTTPREAASTQRIILYGEFDECTPTNAEVERFFKIHPDALDWAPGQPGFHKTYWVKFTIFGVYYIGGFGGENYIGKLPVDRYKAAPIEQQEDEDQHYHSSVLSWFLSWIGI